MLTAVIYYRKSLKSKKKRLGRGRLEGKDEGSRAGRMGWRKTDANFQESPPGRVMRDALNSSSNYL